MAISAPTSGTGPGASTGNGGRGARSCVAGSPGSSSEKAAVPSGRTCSVKGAGSPGPAFARSGSVFGAGSLAQSQESSQAAVLESR
eukprot:6172276-Amphidinium_carterae.1